MLVYGDHSERADTQERLGRIARDLMLIRGMPAGIERHSKLVGVLIAAGQIQQGFEDAVGPTEALSAFVDALAQCVMRSWDSGFQELGILPGLPQIVLPPMLELKLPEGFAFYAVYPETYGTAARRLKLSGPPRVIGVRSIGTTLGAIVAAALGAPAPVTVRPMGEPFARRVELPEDILDVGAHYVIVDEGPGLSGSSFGAVADWLEGRGVPLERIAFLPAHGGDLGPHASDAHRARWGAAQRVAAQFDPAFLADRFGPIEPFCRGGPAERLKFLGQHEGERVLLKFAGLGSIGEQKLELARALHSVGFTPEPLALVHGFLVERWHGDALRLAAEDKPLGDLGHYLGTRARMFPAHDNSGATIADLVAMCRRNLALALGEEAARKVERWKAATLALAVQRSRTDNKLDREEWLRLLDGRLLKTDAIDHHQAHDLIGCQDLAWDVAGAIVEFALGTEEGRDLVEATERAAGRRVNADLLHFYRVAYCCFRFGLARLASESCIDPSDSDRIRSRSIYYETAVMPLLKEDHCCFTRQESLID